MKKSFLQSCRSVLIYFWSSAGSGLKFFKIGIRILLFLFKDNCFAGTGSGALIMVTADPDSRIWFLG